jgi:hypothetical protein
MGWEVAILGATKRQRRSLHAFFARMTAHPEEVANIPQHHADTIIAIAKELAEQNLRVPCFEEGSQTLASKIMKSENGCVETTADGNG